MRVIIFLVPALVPVSSVMPKVNDTRAAGQRCCLCQSETSKTWSLRTFQFDLSWALPFTTKPDCKELCFKEGGTKEGGRKVNKHSCNPPAEQSTTGPAACDTSMNHRRRLVDTNTETYGPHGVEGFEILGVPTVKTRGRGGYGDEEALSFFIQGLQFTADEAWVKAANDPWVFLGEKAFNAFITAYAKALDKLLGKPGADKEEESQDGKELSMEDKQRACERYNECLRRAKKTCQDCFDQDRKDACYFKYDFEANELTMPFKPEAKPVRFRG